MKKMLYLDRKDIIEVSIDVEFPDDVQISRLMRMHKYCPVEYWINETNCLDDYEENLNRLLTWDLIRQHKNYNWSYKILSKNPCITFDIIRQHPDLPWSELEICENPNVTWDILKNNQHMFENKNNFSWNPYITPEIIEANQDIDWDFSILSRTLPWSFIKENTDKEWDIDIMLAYNTSITVDIVKQNYSFFEDSIYFFAQNPNVTVDIFERDDLFECCEDMCFFLVNPNLT